MKTADLKAGETYAVRRAQHPYLLLSTAVYAWRSSDRHPDAYTLAPPGTRPRRDPQGWALTRTHYGFLTIEGDMESLAGVDAESALAAIVATGGRDIPEGTRVNVLTEAAAILAPYAVHEENELLKREATRARWAQEKAARAAAVARHDRVAHRLNAVLGGDVLRAADEYSTPTHIEIPLAQAEALADLLATLNNPEGNSQP